MITGRPGLSVVWCMFPKTETIRSHSSRASKPSNLSPVSNEMISDSVELQFVSYTSNLFEQMYDFPKCTMFFQKWIWILKISRKTESWNSPSLHYFAVLQT